MIKDLHIGSFSGSRNHSTSRTFPSTSTATFYNPKGHRILALTLDSILNPRLTQQDLLDRSRFLDLSPDLLDPPALILLNPTNPPDQSNPKPKASHENTCSHLNHPMGYYSQIKSPSSADSSKPVNSVRSFASRTALSSQTGCKASRGKPDSRLSFVCYHGGHLCKYEITSQQK